MSDADARLEMAPEPEEKPARFQPPGVPPGVVDLGRWPPNKRYAIAMPIAVIGFTNLEFPNHSWRERPVFWKSPRVTIWFGRFSGCTGRRVRETVSCLDGSFVSATRWVSLCRMADRCRWLQKWS